MKPIIFLFILSLFIFSCKNESKQKPITQKSVNQDQPATKLKDKLKLTQHPGYQVYQKSCKVCHLATRKKQMEYRRQGNTPGGPPIKRVALRLLAELPEKTNFIQFVDDFITNPSKEKALMPNPVSKLGLMPPIGKAMSPEDRKAVAEWMYEEFSKYSTPEDMKEKIKKIK